MSNFRVAIKLPAQAATETEATIVAWKVREGQNVRKGEVLAEAESAKAAFPFESPCDCTIVKLLHPAGAVVPFEQPVAEIETADESMRAGTPAAPAAPAPQSAAMAAPAHSAVTSSAGTPVYMLGIGGYVPERVVSNKELLDGLPGMTDEYLFGVTGIRERRWARDGQKPSDLACEAAKDALRKSQVDPSEIGGIVVATTTPDAAMPSTACILQKKLGLRAVPAFDLNAACSGWLYALCVARGLVETGIADNVLVVGVELQSRLLDKNDKDTYFLFGDGAGATVVSRSRQGHRMCAGVLLADAEGMQMARRDTPGYVVKQEPAADPWVRLDGRALFRFATTSFADIIREVVARSGWEPSDVRWVVPHQANARIIKAAASRGGIAFERFYLNIDHVGNTSSASIPLALRELERGMQKGDKLVFCAVGAGVTAGAVTIEW